MNYNNGFARDEFLQYMYEEFPSVFNNTFSREMLENVVDNGIKNHTVSKNSLYYYLKDMIPEVEPKVLIPYIDKELLTNEVLYLLDDYKKAQVPAINYDKIVKCDLEGSSTNDYYENCFLLTGDNVEDDFEVDLTGEFFFNADFKSLNREVVSVVKNVSEVLDFCKEHDIRIPENCFGLGGSLKVGGERDYILNQELYVLGWEEGLSCSNVVRDAEPIEKEPKNNHLGEFDIPALMDTLANNAWYGREPLQMCFVAGDNIIRLDGYTYEPGYEDFSSTSSISFNNEILYGVDSRNVDAYKNEVYDIGRYKTLDDAVSYIREQIKGKELVLLSETKKLDEKINSATARSKQGVSSDGIRKDEIVLE